MDAWNMRDTAWYQEHASDPAVREAVVVGIIATAGSKLETAGEKIRSLVGITDEELRSPKAKGLAEKRAQTHFQLADTHVLTRLHALAGLDRTFFSGSNLAFLEEGVKERVSLSYKDSGQLFSDLVSLPIPQEFYLRPAVMEAAIVAQKVALENGRPDAAAVMRHIGMDTRAFRDPQLRSAAEIGAAKLARFGEDEAFREYAATFGIRNESVPTGMVLEGFQRKLYEGDLKGAKMFAELFPNVSSERLMIAAKTSAARGIQTLVIEGDLERADQMAEYALLTRAERDASFRPAIRTLISIEKRSTLRAIADRWHVPSSVFVDEGANHIRNLPASTEHGGTAWSHAKRAQALVHIPQARFEEAFIQGILPMGERVVERKNRWGGSEPIEERIGQINDFLSTIPDAAFVDRARRRVVQALAKKQFLSGNVEHLRPIQEQFPFMDDAAVRRTAIDGIGELLANNTGNSLPLDPIRKANAWLTRKSLDAITWDDLADKARAWVTRCLMQLDVNGYANVALDALHIPKDVNAAILNETREHVRSVMFQKRWTDQMSVDDRRKNLFLLYGFTWATFPFKDIPLRYLIESDDPELLERRKQDPWNKAIDSLHKLQARSANEEHDPWITDLFPLAARIQTENLLDRESATDGQLLVEYVKAFGMINLPNVSRIYFRLKKGPFSSLPEEDKAQLVELVGSKAARLESEHLINELRMLRFTLQRDFLQDKVPHKINTVLGEEMFQVIRGDTSWGTSDRPTEVFAKWKETVRAAQAAATRWEHEAIRAIADQDDAAAEAAYAKADAERERVEVARGYEERTFTVHKIHRDTRDAESVNDEIQTLVGQAWTSLSTYQGIDGFIRHVRIGTLFADATDLSNLGEDPFDELESLLRDARGTNTEFPLPDKKIFGPFFQTGDDRAFVALMESASRAGDGYLRSLSTIHLSRLAAKQWVDHLAKSRFATEEAELRHRAEFVSQYLKEHYLNPLQEPGHTGHTAFSEQLRTALERAWGTNGDATENALLRADARIRELRAAQNRVSEETVDVTLVPEQGPLRQYAGDLGDACYSSQHMALAEGQYPRVKAMVFVTNRNKPKERLNGSVLFVETRVATTNARTIVMRANNPRQNLVMQVDAATLVRQTIDTAIATARRRRIKHVGIVRDDASMASSNRPEVSMFYASTYGETETGNQTWKPTELVDEPETNFNGYSIWNPESGSPTVIVWTNDDPDAT